MNSINDNLWVATNQAEKEAWDEVLNSQVLIDQTDIFNRHAPVMGLPLNDEGEVYRKIIDIGGGPLSMMLHFKNVYGMIVDPIMFDQKWIERYALHDIVYHCGKAEDFLKYYDGPQFSEVWMYNTLMHTQDPEFILDNLWKVAPVLRISEPVDTPITKHHPHTFTASWYRQKLENISLQSHYTQVQYDYWYVGGVYLLKNNLGVANG